MKYSNIEQGYFIKRQNRFIADVKINNLIQKVHIKNTGRLNELLVEGACVYLQKCDSDKRKTKYDLVSVEIKDSEGNRRYVNIDSFAANDVVEEWLQRSELFGKNAVIRREVQYNKSRFDFYIKTHDREIFLEVKGCTLENDGIAYFPDAPTERGIKHIKELCECIKDGYESYIVFVVQMENVVGFSPNYKTHAEFGETLKRAKNQGVKLMAKNCRLTDSSIEIADDVEIIL